MTKKTDLEVATMGKDIEYIKEKIDLIMDKFDRLDTKYNCLDDKYASKLSERIVYGFCAVVLLAIIGALVRLVLIQ